MSLETVQVASPSVWSSTFARTVYSMFASMHESCRVFADGTGGKDDGNTSIEIEGRLGNATEREKTNQFTPGVSESYFKGMLKHFSAAYNQPPRETFDVTFTSQVRVSVVVKDGQAEVAEVIRKLRDRSKDSFAPVQVVMQGTRRALDVRASMMVEQKVAAEDCFEECEAAKQWVMDYLRGGSSSTHSSSPVAVRSILTGVSCKLSPGVERDLTVYQGSPEFSSEKGWLQPQLSWTTMQPCELLDARGNRVQVNPPFQLMGDSDVVLGNLPGVLHLSSGESIPVALFEFQIRVKAKDVLNGSSSQQTDSAPSAMLDQVSMVRFKKRWKFPNVRPSSRAVLDLTETRQGRSARELRADVTKYEVEMEMSYSITEGISIDPGNEAIAFLTAVCKILAETTPPQVPDSIRDDWKRQPLKTIALGGGENRKRISGAFPHSATATTTGQSYPNKRQATNDPSERETEDFYNKLNRSNKDDRVKSYIYHMRCLNNFAKSCLLRKYLLQLSSTPSIGCRVLELSCGKGADYAKMKKSVRKMARYVGTDIAKVSLEDAVQRLGEDARSSSVTLIQADLTECDISKADWGVDTERDVFTNGSWTKTRQVLDEKEKFSFVSMQFALHYMFCSFEALDRFFHGVSARMLPGGYFVATTVNADALVSALLSSPDKLQVAFKDEKDRVTCLITFEENDYNRLFSSRNGDDADAWVGIKYRFKLFDGDSSEERAVDAPEFMVATPTLQRMAEKHGLTLIDQSSLGSFVMKELETEREAQALWKRMNVPNREGSISDIEWTIANIYQTVVFQKPPPVSTAPSTNPNLFLTALMRVKQELGEAWDTLGSDERNERINAVLASLSSS